MTTKRTLFRLLLFLVFAAVFFTGSALSIAAHTFPRQFQPRGSRTSSLGYSDSELHDSELVVQGFGCLWARRCDAVYLALMAARPYHALLKTKALSRSALCLWYSGAASLVNRFVTIKSRTF